jgi:hypothetical protein
MYIFIYLFLIEKQIFTFLSLFFIFIIFLFQLKSKRILDIAVEILFAILKTYMYSDNQITFIFDQIYKIL